MLDQMLLCLLFQSSSIEIHRGIDLRGLCAVVLVSMSSREQQHFAKNQKADCSNVRPTFVRSGRLVEQIRVNLKMLAIRCSGFDVLDTNAFDVDQDCLVTKAELRSKISSFSFSVLDSLFNGNICFGGH